MEYSLKPLSKPCYVTGNPLEPGSLCYSVLIENNGRYERQDFSQDAWNGVPDSAIGVWRTVVPEAEVQSSPLRDPDQLFDLFADLAENANDQQRQMRYVLALWLIRKKRLVLEETRETADGSVLQLAGARGEGNFEIPEESISETEMARLQSEIEAMGQAPQRQAA